MFLFSMCLLFVLNAPYSILSESYFTFSYSCSFFPSTHTYTLNHINPMDFCFSPLSIVLYGMHTLFLSSYTVWLTQARRVNGFSALLYYLPKILWNFLCISRSAKLYENGLLQSALQMKMYAGFFWFFANALPNMKQRKIKGRQTAESEMR